MLWRKGSGAGGNGRQDATAASVQQGPNRSSTLAPSSGATQGGVSTGVTNSQGRTPLPVSEEVQKHRAAVAIRQSLAFAQIVSVLARSSSHKFFTLADLEWLVIPPLMNGQYAVAESKVQPAGPAFPVAAVLWANVAPDVDKRLTEAVTVPIRLRPDEWRSGEILWLVDAIGDGRVLPGFLEKLRVTVWKDRLPKMRAVGADGKITITNLGEAARAAT